MHTERERERALPIQSHPGRQRRGGCAGVPITAQDSDPRGLTSGSLRRQVGALVMHAFFEKVRSHDDANGLQLVWKQKKQKQGALIFFLNKEKI